MNKKNRAKFASMELHEGVLAKRIRDLVGRESILLSANNHLVDQVSAGLGEIAGLKRQASVKDARFDAADKELNDEIVALKTSCDLADKWNANLRRDNERLRSEANVENKRYILGFKMQGDKIAALEKKCRVLCVDIKRRSDRIVYLTRELAIEKNRVTDLAGLARKRHSAIEDLSCEVGELREELGLDESKRKNEISRKLDTLEEWREKHGERIQVKAEQDSEAEEVKESRKVSACSRLVRLLWPRAGRNACQDCRVGGARNWQSGGSDIREG